MYIQPREAMNQIAADTHTNASNIVPLVTETVPSDTISTICMFPDIVDLVLTALMKSAKAAPNANAMHIFWACRSCLQAVTTSFINEMFAIIAAILEAMPNVNDLAPDIPSRLCANTPIIKGSTFVAATVLEAHLGAVPLSE
jgi:hypothetical protein